jgi:DNA polymerase elongation subunit (family B)
LNNFIISKQVNKDYKIKNIPTEYKKFKKRMEDLGIYNFPPENNINFDKINEKISEPSFTDNIEWLQKYILKSKPAHIQLALKMTQRGKPVEVGSRIEYIIIQHYDDPKAKLYDKLEDPNYFYSHRDILRLDKLYYIKLLSEPMDQLLFVVFKQKDFVSKLYDLHLNHYKLMNEIYSKNKPIILLGDEIYKPKTIKKKNIQKSIYDYI